MEAPEIALGMNAIHSATAETSQTEDDCLRLACLPLQQHYPWVTAAELRHLLEEAAVHRHGEEPAPDWVTVNEAAKRLKVCSMTVYRMASAEEPRLRRYRVGKGRNYRLDFRELVRVMGKGEIVEADVAAKSR